MAESADTSLELTILMPCLNEAETLARCIEKAKIFLSRNGIAGEVLIADNGSTDGSQAIAQNLGVRVIDVPIRGYGAALSYGIAAAHGRYVIMGPVFAVLLLVAWRRRIVTFTQIYAAATLAMLSLCILAVAGWMQHGLTPRSAIFLDEGRGKLFMHAFCAAFILTGLMIVSALPKFIVRYWRNLRPPYVIPAFAGMFTLIVLFYIRFVPAVVEWLYSNSFGHQAAAIEKPPMIDIIALYLHCAGQLPMVGLSVLALLAFFFCIPSEQKKLLRQPVLYLAAVIPFSLLLTLGSKQYFSRKVTIVFCAYMLIAANIALLRGKWFQLRFCLVTLLAGAQLAASLWIGTGHPHNGLLDNTTGARDAYPLMVTTRPNPYDVAADFIGQNARRFKVSVIRIPQVNPLDPFLLSMIVQIRYAGIISYYPYLATYSDHAISDIFASTQGRDGVLLVTPRDAAVHSAQAAQKLLAMRAHVYEPTDKLVYELLADSAADSLKNAGLTELACTSDVLPDYTLCLYEFGSTAK